MVDKIAVVPRDKNDRPKKEVRVMEARIIK